MRIRKNAKLIFEEGSSTAVPGAAVSSSSSSSSSFLICQLNRSPWDVLDVYSFQVDGDDSFGLNLNGGSCFANSIPASYSLPSGESMELSFEYVEKPPPVPPKRDRELPDELLAGLEQDLNGWRFDHPPAPKKVSPPPPPPSAAPKRRGRPRKTTTAAAAPTAANPQEFYYYSGFGPKWGKSRRGGERSSSSAIVQKSSGSSSTTQMMSEDEDEFHDNGTVKTKPKPKPKNKTNTKTNKASSNNGVDLLESVADGELDYIDDEDDDEEERELYGGGIRRARKLIKARSLKSLM